MFHNLFERPHALKRQLNSKFLKERLLYLHHRAEQGAARSTLREIAIYQLPIIEYLHLEKLRIVTIREIGTAAKSWMHHQSRDVRFQGNASHNLSKYRFFKHTKKWLGFWGRLEAPVTQPISPQVSAYAEYMRKEKGLSEETIWYRCREIEIFLSKCRRQGYTLSQITIRKIDAILIRELNRQKYSRSTIQTYASTLRNFIRFAQMHKWCKPGIADAIKAPRVFQHSTLPSAPTWEEVNRLMKTTAGRDPTDIRDRAILMLFAVYGLRSREVSRLRLEDFNWERGVLFLIRAKEGRPQQFPIKPEVGQTIITYLKKVRPHSAFREVFLTMRAPYRPLTRGALFQIVSRRWKPLNVSIVHHGPHSLRHACATRLINQGASLKIIADHLGHRSMETSRIYTKVDIVRLRIVADLNLGGLL
jgi:integrase/recombinase XerD